MRSYGPRLILLVALGLVACLGGPPRRPFDDSEPMWQASFRDPALGTVHLMRHLTRPGRLIFFVTGDGGWNAEASDVANTLAGENALVAGIDVGEWRDVSGRSGDSCADFARPLGGLAARLKPELSSTRDPVVIVGHSTGATVAFLALSQAPSAEFVGAISLGFSPVIEYPIKPCSAPGFAAGRANASEFALQPAVGQLQRPWWLLQGTEDRVTPLADAKAFADKLHTAHFISIAGQGHTFGGVPTWVPAVKRALSSLAGGPKLSGHSIRAWERPS